ncbi:hypothetical protein TX23_03825 [Pseudomonas paralactis]|uniref:GmrSD restriction endonucleases N-terminal domain-containing protein n=1 Tax=Pseudomonas paralactis TaxID=1615673 RepID=A0A0R3APW9_9PSED|nr:DUF262 domain-containing protein [Pseudomonas paralactis]KRP75318.1 hypothetical protein TX23_03825 [Pseudomonas paralactis]
MDIVENIDQSIGEVRTESLDLSFGEIVNLHSSKELIIHPDYQRLFRWSDDQKSRLIESIILELPVPQIFVIENENGILELIDGLQRVSSVIQFMEPEKLSMDALILTGCDLIKELNGKAFSDLPLTVRLRIKRSSVRTIMIKRQSKPFLKYEMFKRLNTGGAILAPQEIRNCSARMIGTMGDNFYSFLKECANLPQFKTCTETLSQSDYDKKGDEELVLRFFATKNSSHTFKGSVRDWLDTYMEQVLLEEINFDFGAELNEFTVLFDYLANSIGTGAFVKYRGENPVGALAPAYYEAVSIGVWRALKKDPNINADTVQLCIMQTVQTEEFRNNTGPGANSKEKLEGRISAIERTIEEAHRAKPF